MTHAIALLDSAEGLDTKTGMAALNRRAGAAGPGASRLPGPTLQLERGVLRPRLGGASTPRRRYLGSLGRFDNAGALLLPLYGAGELPQAFARLAVRSRPSPPPPPPSEPC